MKYFNHMCELQQTDKMCSAINPLNTTLHINHNHFVISIKPMIHI